MIQRATLDTRKDAERNLAQSRAQAVRALEILLGRYPAAALGLPEQFTALPPDVPAGLPSDLLERRPDVVAAEQRVSAAFYQVEEAKTARLPRISLTAGVNAISSDLLLLKNRDNPMWSVGGGLMAPIFSGGALQGQLDARNAEQKAAIAAYAQSALNAFGEVENALSGDIALRDRDALLSDAVNVRERLLALAAKRKQIGPGDQRDVVNAELNLLAARSDLLHIQGMARVQRVNLYLALGGGLRRDSKRLSALIGAPRSISEPDTVAVQRDVALRSFHSGPKSLFIFGAQMFHNELRSVKNSSKVTISGVADIFEQLETGHLIVGYLNKIAMRLNQRPRKTLGFESPGR